MLQETDDTMETRDADEPLTRNAHVSYNTESHNENPIFVYNPLVDTRVEEKRPCCRVIDYSEPFFLLVAILSTIGAVEAAIERRIFSLVVLLVACLGFLVSLWRVRKLGVAASLAESVELMKEQLSDMETQCDTLRSASVRFAAENENLKNQIARMGTVCAELRNTSMEFAAENNDLREIVGLVGDKVGDVNKAAFSLQRLYQKYKSENQRQEFNNLVGLVLAVDRDENSRLDEKELDLLVSHFSQVYGVVFDRSKLAHDEDGFVTIAETLREFSDTKKRAMNSCAEEAESEETMHQSDSDDSANEVDV